MDSRLPDAAQPAAWKTTQGFSTAAKADRHPTDRQRYSNLYCCSLAALEFGWLNMWQRHGSHQMMCQSDMMAQNIRRRPRHGIMSTTGTCR